MNVLQSYISVDHLSYHRPLHFKQTTVCVLILQDLNGDFECYSLENISKCLDNFHDALDSRRSNRLNITVLPANHPVYPSLLTCQFLRLSVSPL